jgi:hypothetical protein
MKIRETQFLFLMVLFCSGKLVSQKKDSVSHRNVGVTLSCSVLEGNGIRAEYPGYFYSGKTHGFSVAATGKFLSDNSAAFGINAGYFYFLEPSFRDISFFLNYNVSYFFEDHSAFTHIINVGTQIDIGKRTFIQHSIGIGAQQSASDFNYLHTVGQLKLSLGVYLREIPVVHIHDDWEH